MAKNKYGKRRSDKIYDEFVSGPLHKGLVKSILRDLEQLGYIRTIVIPEQEVMFSNETNNELVFNAGYQITSLGKNAIAGKVGTTTIYSDIHNSAIAHQSTNIHQSIKVSEQTPDIQEKITELQDAITKKDSTAIKKAFGYIADKSVDVAIAIIAGSLLR